MSSSNRRFATSLRRRSDVGSSPREAQPDYSRIAVLLPCYNEEATVGQVIDDVRANQPDAYIVVFDNNSTDRSAIIATERNVRVVRVSRQGKGNVVRAMLKKVEADVYVMLDADATYPADRIPDLINPVLDGTSDMVVGARLGSPEAGAFRRFHHIGNVVLCRTIRLIWGARLTDVLSGYRAFTSEVARILPVVSSGFEVETEMTVQALFYNMTISEVDVEYRARPAGSFSKLRSYRDGFAIGLQVLHLLRAYKPLTFFGGLGLVCFGIALMLGLSTSVDLSQPAGILAATLILLGALLTSTGLILHTLNFRVKELHSIITRRPGP
jgi:glycosyltransferase involved in cell wall biosynthesis